MKIDGSLGTFVMYLLDTNVISELRQGKPLQSQAVRAWAGTVAANQLYLSAISILELEKGVLALERRTPPQGSSIRHWLTGVREAFAGRILPFTDNTATVCAGLHHPFTRPERDAMIAATAREHRMSLVTRNVKDFAGIDVPLVNPFEA